MSGADDQRLAPTETQRLRNQIDDLTRERDLYKRMLERYEPDPTYSTPTELDRLRAELAETRAAGDSLAAIASVMTEDSTTERWDSLGEAIHTYWSVRGDARTAPAADVRDPASETHRTSAAPTAAPDVRAWEDDGDWGWACSRCGYRSVAWWADRATARRAAHEHGRDRCPAAGGPSPASTDGGEQ